MNLEELREGMNLKNKELFLKYFLEADDEIEYVIIPNDYKELKEDSIIHRKELIDILDRIKFEIVNPFEGYCTAMLDNKIPVTIEYL